MIDLESRRADAAHRWWRALGPQAFDNGYRTPGDRATLAKLRRCSTALDAALEPATVRLFRAMEFDVQNEAHFGKAATLAAVLSHVRKESQKSVAFAIGAPSGGMPEDALLKPNRFRTLMTARTDDEILTAFRRVVALLDRTANVSDLARLILGWTDDEAGDRTRTRFAFAYHGAAAYAPDDKNETISAEKV